MKTHIIRFEWMELRKYTIWSHFDSCMPFICIVNFFYFFDWADWLASHRRVTFCRVAYDNVWRVHSVALWTSLCLLCANCIQITLIIFFSLVQIFNAPFVWLSHLAPIHSFRSYWNLLLLHHKTEVSGRNRNIANFGNNVNDNNMTKTIIWHQKQKRWWDCSLFIPRIFSVTFWSKYAKKKRFNLK